MAKLRGRITQRLAGTRSVLLSMSGYSDEALEGIVRGQQLDMLLLDRTHLEAMLSGLRSPADLSGRRFFLAGDGHVGVVDLDKTSTVPIDDQLRSPHPDGHGVAVLLKIYAHCIDGQATAANQRIAEALGTQDAEEDPGDEGDGDMEQAS
jgi:hypothetical protein